MKNISKTTKTILFASLIAAMILPFSTMDIAFADKEEKNKNTSKKHPSFRDTKINMHTSQIKDSQELLPLSTDNSPLLLEDILKKHPLPNDENKNKFSEKIAKNDKRVKKLMGENFTFSSTSYYFDGKKWQPEFTFDTKDSKHKVTVTMENDKVKKIKKYKSEKLSHSEAAFGIQLIQNQAPMSGNHMALNAPDYIHNGDVIGEPNWTALLLNSMKSGSSWGNVCDSTNLPNDYWGQIGLNFDNLGIRVGYTDTALDCSRQFFNLPVNTGDRINFFTTIDNATDKWILMAQNLDIPAPNAYAYYRIVPNSDLMANSASDVGTNVFFENQNSASTAWSLGFAQDVIVDYAGFKHPSNGNWYYWQSDAAASGGCHPGPITTGDLTSGSFAVFPRDVTFDVSNMDTICGQN